MDRQYQKRSELMYKLIQKKHENISLYFNKESGFYELHLKALKWIITILPDATIEEIEHIISKKSGQPNVCKICTKVLDKKTSCTKCGEQWCIDCYCKLFESGQGIITCPFCRFSFGYHWLESMIPVGIREIKEKAGCQKPC